MPTPIWNKAFEVRHTASGVVGQPSRVLKSGDIVMQGESVVSAIFNNWGQPIAQIPSVTWTYSLASGQNVWGSGALDPTTTNPEQGASSMSANIVDLKNDGDRLIVGVIGHDGFGNDVANLPGSNVFFVLKKSGAAPVTPEELTAEDVARIVREQLEWAAAAGLFK